MILEDIGMLLVSSPRSKAYLQMLLRHGFKPSYVIIMDDGSNRISPGQLPSDRGMNRPGNQSEAIQKATKEPFDLEEPLIETLSNAGVEFGICRSMDVNSEIVIDEVRKRPEKYFVYSGLGGVILREGILNTGKRFLHVHPGRVPDFRGSTTVYYSILEEDRCGASAFFFDRNIDTGDLIMIKEYPKPVDGTLIDYVYDPYVRADLLVESIRRYVDKGTFGEKKQENDGGETYYIIHPVLKHIAILSCGAND
jgi:methionyl-tRNA formyltransferase